MYELFEHTADLGLRVRAGDLNTLFAEAGRGLFSMIVENLDDVRPLQTISVQLTGNDRAYLLFDWLSELLVVFDTRHVLLGEFNVHVDETGLTATARGEPAEPPRHRLDHEIKAITYHGLKVEPVGDGWQAEVIVDV